MSDFRDRVAAALHDVFGDDGSAHASTADARDCRYCADYAAGLIAAGVVVDPVELDEADTWAEVSAILTRAKATTRT